MDLKFGEMVGRCSCNWAVWHHLRDMYLCAHLCGSVWCRRSRYSGGGKVLEEEDPDHWSKD